LEYSNQEPDKKLTWDEQEEQRRMGEINFENYTKRMQQEEML
jgi:hypothetical protein